MKDFTSVKSSNIDGAKYDAASKSLTVKFKSGSVYEYTGVPHETYSQFAATFQSGESSGGFLNKHIKKFPAKKL
jgi:hypothetical protein